MAVITTNTTNGTHVLEWTPVASRVQIGLSGALLFAWAVLSTVLFLTLVREETQRRRLGGVGRGGGGRGASRGCRLATTARVLALLASIVFVSSALEWLLYFAAGNPNDPKRRQLHGTATGISSLFALGLLAVALMNIVVFWYEVSQGFLNGPRRTSNVLLYRKTLLAAVLVYVALEVPSIVVACLGGEDNQLMGQTVAIGAVSFVGISIASCVFARRIVSALSVIEATLAAARPGQQPGQHPPDAARQGKTGDTDPAVPRSLSGEGEVGHGAYPVDAAGTTDTADDGLDCPLLESRSQRPELDPTLPSRHSRSSRSSSSRSSSSSSSSKRVITPIRRFMGRITGLMAAVVCFSVAYFVSVGVVAAGVAYLNAPLLVAGRSMYQGSSFGLVWQVARTFRPGSDRRA